MRKWIGLFECVVFVVIKDKVSVYCRVMRVLVIDREVEIILKRMLNFCIRK